MLGEEVGGAKVDGKHEGKLAAHASAAWKKREEALTLHSRTGSAEQSNTSILFGNKLILKLFRRLQPGENPDVEVGRFLTEKSQFPQIATYLGDIAITHPWGDRTTVAMLQKIVANEGDGWQWLLRELEDWLVQISSRDAIVPSPEAGSVAMFTQELIATESLPLAEKTLEAAELLGRRTAELHLALAKATEDPAFLPEPITSEELRRDAQRVEAQLHSALRALKERMSALEDATTDRAATLLSKRAELLARAGAITSLTPAGLRIRIHGDYHLGQTLRTPGGDFVLIDFEGEPARPLAERRRKQSPLKDVAGMLRSFSYAAAAALDGLRTSRGEELPGSLTVWAESWERAAASRFVRGYRTAIAANPRLLPPEDEAQALLEVYLLEKALYEMQYELNNRPAWLSIPLTGILSLQGVK